MGRTLKIKARLLLTVGFVAAMFIAGTAVAIWSMRTIDKQTGQLVQRDVKMASAAGQFALQVSAMVGRERTYFVEDSPGSKQSASEVQGWKTAYAAALDRLKEIEALSPTTDERAVVDSLRATITSYEKDFDAARALAERGSFVPFNPEGAEAKAMRAKVDMLETRSTDFFDACTKKMSAAGVAAQANISAAYIGLVVALVLGLLALAAFTRQFVYGPILAEANALTKVCNAVAVGDLTSRVPDPTESELGAVARSLNTMLDNTVSLVQSKDERDQMQASIMRLLEQVSGVAAGDLTAEAEVTGDMTGAVADSFNIMLHSLRQIIGQVQGASRQVSGSLNDLRSISDKLASGAEDQAAQSLEASAAMEEMVASIRHVSENASSSASVAEQARSNAEHGARAVSRTIEGMKAVRDQVQETAKRIKRLGESSQEIGEIVELIGDIADRTSILALNASIQAAMAGDAGRGFAVVADEVERLADRATEATKRAAMLVKTTQSETAEVMAAMEDTTREVVNRSTIANEAGTALAEIQSVSNRLAELIQGISDAAQQQSRGSQQVARSMTEMSSVTRSTAASTKQTADSISSLAMLADGLNAAIAPFKLPSKGGAAVAQPRLVASR